MMHKKPVFPLLAVLLVLATVVAGCHEQGAGDGDGDGTPGPSPTGGEGTLRIGLLMPLTGDVAGLGVPAANAARLAIEEINAAGGVNGRQLALVEGDSQYPSSTEPVAQFERMVGMGVQVVVGDLASDSTRVVVPRANDAEVVLISPASTDPALTGPDHGFFYRVIANDTLQGPQAAELLFNDLGEESVVVMYQQTSYATGLKDEFVPAYEGKGGTVNGAPIEYGTDLSTFDSLAQQARNRNPAYVWIAGQVPQVENMIKSLRDQGYAGGVLASEAIESPRIFDVACDELDGVLFTKAAPPTGSRTDAFNSAYEERWDEGPGPYSPFAYDAVYVAKAAIEAAGNDGPAIKEWLDGANSVPDRVTTATIAFNDNGDVTTGGYTLWEIACSGGTGSFRAFSV